MEQVKYFIHGNGQDSTCAPVGFLADDMPGHGDQTHDSALYSIDKLTNFFASRIPQGSLVLGHSLGGHIALNIALIRPDIKVYVCGMAPIEGLHEIGPVMTPVTEFTAFQNPLRTDVDIRSFIESVHSRDDNVVTTLFKAAKKQDPQFNMTLFTSGIEFYDWSERTKAASLGDRVCFIISKNEKCYDASFLLKTNINMIQNDYQNHTPWLYEPNWFESILTNSTESRPSNMVQPQP